MYDTIVIGAGPAGMMAAITASNCGDKVLIIEKNNKVGRKLELTGGSRCNVLNLKNNKNFINSIPVNNKFLYSTLNNFGPNDIYNYFISSGVKLKIEDNDRVFPCSDDSKTIIDLLHKKMIDNNVTIHLKEAVLSISKDLSVKTDKNTYFSKKIIITTGGKSYPVTGSTGDGYTFSKAINQPVTSLYPAETFLYSKKPIPLSGLTLDYVVINFNKLKVDGPLLFTHFGISGPAVFKISEEVYKQLDNAILKIDLASNYTSEQLINMLNNYNPKKEVISFVREILKKRLADYIVDSLNINIKIGDLSKIQKNLLISTIKNFEIEISKTGTIEQSFVTGGGVDLKYINPKTMESTINPGIYYAGEVLDIHGHTGGYNITIALSTGYSAGMKKS